MNLLRLLFNVRLYVGLIAVFVGAGIQSMDQRGMPQKNAAKVIQKALGGFRKLTYEQKIVRKLNFEVDTEIDVEKIEFWNGLGFNCYLLHEKSRDAYGRIIYFLSQDADHASLSRLEVESDYRGCGVGEYLFNCMIKHLYDINDYFRKNGKKTYTRVTWTASPLDDTWWDGDEDVLERLIKFYESLGGKVEWKGHFTARMYFELEK